MERFISQSFLRCIAMLLCMAMLLPMFPVMGSAAQIAGTEETVGSVEATETPEETVKESLPETPTGEPEDSAEMTVPAVLDAAGDAVPVIQITGEFSIPAYTGGTTSDTMEYDCGNGVTDGGEKSYLTIITGTDSDEFLAYRQTLADCGYVLVMEKDVDSDNALDPNRFASYTDSEGKYKLYTYHFPYYQETRIIVDTQEDTVAGFSYTEQNAGEVEPMLVQYGLSMATNGYDGKLTETDYGEGRRNCGALIVIRMPDRSLFINDGGDIQQWSDAACNDFLAFCRELTGVPEGEKMVINTWFLSHAHTDHYLGFPRFINKYHDQFELKNIMYNIDIERTDTTRDIYDVMQLVSGFYPGVKYYKPHTGESFEIDGVRFDVMYSHEDRYLPNENGELITDYPTLADGKYDLGGTYRDYSYATNGNPATESDFNDTSVVLNVTFENGVNSILYADLNRSEQTLFDIYPDSALKGDIVMVPHHGFDTHPELMAMSGARVFLYTQHKQAIYGPDGDYTTKDADGTFRPKLRNNFIPMKDAIDATGAVEGTDYKFYWAGSETVALDINAMGGGAEAQNVPASLTLDAAAPAGVVAYTTNEVNNDIYENEWTIYDLNDGVSSLPGSMDNLIDVAGEGAAEGVTATTLLSRFKRVTDAPVLGGKYLFRSDAYPQYIMSYSAVAKTNGTVNEISTLVETKENPTSSTATNLFYQAIVNNVEYVYLDQSNRDNVLWILKQYNDNMAERSELTAYTGNDDKEVSWISGTDGLDYRFISFRKGTASTDEPFWYAVEGNDATGDQYRFLDPRYISKQSLMQPALYVKDTDNHHRRYYMEHLSDDTFLIYYRADATDIRILTCDANGNWGTVRYDDEKGDYPFAQLAQDIDKLKLRLYEYKTQGTKKTIDFSGPTTFYVEQGTTAEQLWNFIAQNIHVDNTDRRNLAIPCSGETPKVGYYWLDFNKTFASDKAGTFTVTLKFRNDDGSDTTVYGNDQKLTVHVAGIEAEGTTSYTVIEGTSQTAVEALIKDGIAVKQTAGGTTLNNLTYTSIPTEGDYYWLDFNVPYDSSASGSEFYTVSVKYRNPDGTDAVASTKVTVQVLRLKLNFTGATRYFVEEGVTEDAVRDMIADSITVTEQTQNTTVSYTDEPTVGSYWLEFDSAFDSSAGGDHDYFVNVYYRNADGTDKLIKTLAVFVEQEITSWSAPGELVGTVSLNAGLTTVAQKIEGDTAHNITFQVNGQNRYVTVGLLTDAKGNRVDTSKADTYENLTLTYGDQVICKNFTLIVAESNDVLDYPQKGEEGYVGVDKQSPTPVDEFKETGVAEIELSATGEPVKRGIDLIVIMDLSGSMKNEMGTNVDAVNYEDSRAVAMEQALKAMIQMLGETGADVTIAMSDFGDLDHDRFAGSVVDETIAAQAVFDVNFDNGRYLSSSNVNKVYEFTNQLNYVFRSGEALELDPYGRHVSKIGTFANVVTKYNMAHPLYTGIVEPTIYTGTGEVEAGAFMDVDKLYQNGAFTATMDGIISKIDENIQKGLGTNYDIGLEYAYQLGYAKQQANIANGQNRDIVCIFMSDGAATQYNYFSGRSDSQSWADYLMGDFESIPSAGYDEQNMPELVNVIAQSLLNKLVDGTLTRPAYNRHNTELTLYANIGDAEPVLVEYVDDEYFMYQTRLD